jgi:hypothetical protein
MENWLLMQTFYHGSTTSTHETIDATTGGAFLSLNLRDATTLVEKMASNQSWNEERTQPRKRGGGMHQLKKIKAGMKNILSLTREEECINSKR